jgi:replicative DNA helicase
MPSNIDPAYVAREAEASLVAALFSDVGIDVFNRISLVVSEDDFVTPEGRATFSAFTALVAASQTPDSTTLVSRIKSSQGFYSQLGEAVANAYATPYSLENVEQYARAVAEKSNARKIKQRLDVLSEQTALIGGERTSAEVLQDVDALSTSFEKRSSEVELLKEPQEALDVFLARQEDIQQGDYVGIPSGIEELDRKVTMGPGNLVIVAARPGMGKTVLAQNIAVAGVKHGDAQAEDEICAFFSLEMETPSLLNRWMAHLGSIDYARILKSSITDDEWGRLPLAMDRYIKANVRIDTDAILTPSILRSKIRLLKTQTKKKIGKIIVDYLQLMSADRRDRGWSNRQEEITEISRQLKLIAKEEKAVVVALSQLNRGVESRPNKRPGLADLRESGAIEQDADIIMFVYRDDYYNPDSDFKGQAEIIVGKGREGGVGTVFARFQGQFQCFSDLPQHQSSYENSFS